MDTNVTHEKVFDDKVTAFARKLIAEKMNGLTQPQIDLFNKMYKGIDVISFEKMSWAYAQVSRTVDKNIRDENIRDENIRDENISEMRTLAKRQ